MEKSSSRILLIEDNYDISENIAEYFEALGYVLDFAQDGKQGLDLALNHNYDVIILDVMLPRLDGFSVCAQYKEQAAQPAPILMLTALDSLDDKLAGFDRGAEDYLVKPFALQELEARVKVLLRHKPPSQASNLLKVADLEFNRQMAEVHRAGKLLSLNQVCLKLLECLMLASPHVVSRQELEFSLWGDEPPTSDSLRSHLYGLRKIVDKPFKDKLIHTIHGIGFQIKEPDESN